jgi:hypothetical protein
MDSVHQTFSPKEKHDNVDSIDLLVENAALHTKACPTTVIHGCYFWCRQKVFSKIDEFEKEFCFHAFNKNGIARKIHPGHVGHLALTKEQLSV